ncbi:MAG: FAD-dependent oxidoreductase, partial [Rhodobacteraceae bacterium]|nr:FAD-dependent oxidoreductase [Paracoccaceae bacterium]
MTDNVYNLDRIENTRAPAEYNDDVDDIHYVPAPCQVACPVGTDVPSYLAYVWEKKWPQAFEAITATNPFSSICGRVCDAPCEPACRRAQSDGPLAIRNLKRTVMDRLGADFKPEPHLVTRSEKIAIVGAGPSGLAAAQDLATHGFEVNVYERSDRPGGMMVWGIPGFRLPTSVVQDDMERLFHQCPGIKLHLNCGLGDGVTLEQLKSDHSAVLLTLGAPFGKPMGIPGENNNALVEDGVSFLRRINSGERPELPETVVVVGGGDVAMDACRAALRMPGCKRVKIVYRRGPEEIPARRDELEGAIAENIEFSYNTQQVSVEATENSLVLNCLRTEMGEPDPKDGRRRPEVVPGSEHRIVCGLVIAAVGQKTTSEHLSDQGLMGWDRVETDWDTMRTKDPQVFAAGDGAFGGSSIVMAMSHGQRAAYYMRQFLDGIEDPIPYHTPYRTRRVKVAADTMWEQFPRHEQEFHGLGQNPADFPEIESAYSAKVAHEEAARCYRCDAETGSSDYSVTNREDIFSMARTNPLDLSKNRAMLGKRLTPRDDPFPKGRPASLDDLVFLPANLSRLVIDPYREACHSATDIMGKLDLPNPFLVGGMDSVPSQVFNGVMKGVQAADSAYVGARDPGAGVNWFQVLDDEAEPAVSSAVGVVFDCATSRDRWKRSTPSQLLGVCITKPADVERIVTEALDAGCDFLLLDGTGGKNGEWSELRGAPNLEVLNQTIACLRRIKREEHIDIVWYGGARSGTDAAKLIAMGVKAVVYGVPAALAVGGTISGDNTITFNSDGTTGEKGEAINNLLKAHVGEATMMARCTGKTRLHNLEPEDLRSITLATCEATGIPLAGRATKSIEGS